MTTQLISLFMSKNVRLPNNVIGAAFVATNMGSVYLVVLVFEIVSAVLIAHTSRSTAQQLRLRQGF